MTEQAGRAGARNWLLWIFAGIGLAAAIAVIALAVFVMTFAPAVRREPAELAAKAPGETYRVIRTESLRGTGWIAIEIGVDGGGGSYSGRGSDVRNVILLDTATGDSRRLLPDNSRTIRETHWLSAAAADAGDEDRYLAKDADAPAIAYFALVVARKDGAGADLVVGTLATGRQGVVASAIDGVDALWMADTSQLAMLVRNHKLLEYRVVDIPALKPVSAHRVPIE